MPVEQRLASGEGRGDILDREHGNVMGDTTNKRIPNEIADLGSCHSGFRKLGGVCTSF